LADCGRGEILYSQREFEINCSVKNLDPWLEKKLKGLRELL
jgi:hypothetical protein